MELAPSGIPISFEVTFDVAGLAVAMLVYEVKPDRSRVLVAGPGPMADDGSSTYVGVFTPSAGKSYLVVKAVYTDNTFTIRDLNYSAASETIQSGGVDVSVIVPSIAQTNKKFVALPDVSGALMDWLQPMIFTLISKAIKGFQVKETPTIYSFMGVWQPFSVRQLEMKPRGQRAWSWYMLHALPGLLLKADDVVAYDGVQYRVMQVNEYPLYGFNEFHLVEDYTGSGPST